jgi:hypothetical protein
LALHLKHVEIGLTAIVAGDDLERVATAMLADVGIMGRDGAKGPVLRSVARANRI